MGLMWMPDKYETSCFWAHKIMGKNFLGVDAAIRCFNLSMTDKIAMAFSVVPFIEPALESAKNDHILVADFGISLLDLRDRVKRGLFCDQDWYDSYSWAKNMEAPQWKLIRRTEVPDSFNGSWKEQQNLLKIKEFVPGVRQMAYAIMLNYLENNERLFKRFRVRTSDMDSYGNHVALGGFRKIGLRIRSWYNGSHSGSVGLASARKF